MLSWLLYTMLVGGLLTLAAHCVGRVFRLLAYPTRWVWVSAMTLTVILAGIAPSRAAVLSSARSTRRTGPLTGSTVRQPAMSSTGRFSESVQFVRRAMPIQTITIPAQRVPVSLDAYLAVAWGTLSALVLLFFSTVYLCFRYAQRDWPISDLHGVRVRIAPDGGPVVIGLRHPEIVVPQWLLGRSAEEQRMVLTHEQEHIRAGDPWVLAVACVIAALLPWHPLVWWMVSRLRLAIELDCDTRVLGQGVAPRTYGSLLIDLAERCSGLPALALADNRSHLKRRLLAMRPLRPRFVTLQEVFFSTSALLLLVTACVAEISAPHVSSNVHGQMNPLAQATMTAPHTGATQTRSYGNPAQLLTAADSEAFAKSEDAAWITLDQSVFIDGVRYRREFSFFKPVVDKRFHFVVVDGDNEHVVFNSDTDKPVCFPQLFFRYSDRTYYAEPGHTRLVDGWTPKYAHFSIVFHWKYKNRPVKLYDPDHPFYDPVKLDPRDDPFRIGTCSWIKQSSEQDPGDPREGNDRLTVDTAVFSDPRVREQIRSTWSVADIMK